MKRSMRIKKFFVYNNLSKMFKAMLPLFVVAFFSVAGMVCNPIEACAKDDRDIITGFEQFDILGNYLYLWQDCKPTEGEAAECMPETLGVYLNGSEEVTQIPVTWFCIEVDFEETEYYYYQFSPSFDDSLYELDKNIDLYTQAPYIGVVLQDAQNGISLMSVTESPYEQQVHDYMTKNLGYTEALACGIMSNIYSESTFYPNNLQNSYEKSLGFTDASYTQAVDNGTYTNFVRDSAGYGLCQWTYYSRKQALYDMVKARGVSIAHLPTQLDFLNLELKSANINLRNTIANASNNEEGAYSIGYDFCYYFEAPAAKETASVTRGNRAKNEYWKEYGFTAKREGASLTISDSIKGFGLNYFLRISPRLYCNGAKLKITADGKEQIYPLDENIYVKAADGDYVYKVTTLLAAAQMADKVKYSVYDANDKLIFEEATSIQEYAKLLFDQNLYPNTWALVKCMLNYGAAAQLYFNYNADNLANDILKEEERQIYDLKDIEMDESLPIFKGEIEGINYYGSSMILDATITLRHYFYLGEGERIENYSFLYGDNKLTPKEKNGVYYIDISGLGYDKFSTYQKISILKGDEKLDFDYSISNYIWKAKNNDNYKIDFGRLLAQQYIFAGYFK